MKLTRETETTVLAALALAALHYSDPRPVFEAIRELRPDVDWSEWVDSAYAVRAERRAASAGK